MNTGASEVSEVLSLRMLPYTQPPCFSSHVYLYSVLSFVLTVAMVSLLPGQLPGVLHPQPAKQRDPKHAEETLPGFRKSRRLQSHHLQRVSVLKNIGTFVLDTANFVF